MKARQRDRIEAPAIIDRRHATVLPSRARATGGTPAEVSKLSDPPAVDHLASLVVADARPPGKS